MEYRKKEATSIHYYSDRLKYKLNRLRASSATIIEAPSGYGKTTAVRDYLRENIPQSVDRYWFTAVDEEPEAEYRRLCYEIKKIDERAGSLLLSIGLPNAFTIGETCDILRSVECDRDCWLVIDDFQSLNAGLSSSFLIALLEHGGRNLHIVIITQMLSREMHRAIAGRGFLYITASDLRLDAKDIFRYYSSSGMKITKKDAETIAHFTEGWIIAVYLQMIVYRETGEFSSCAIIPLMDHLIWGRLTEGQQTFLLYLSPFETVTLRQACALGRFETLPGYAMEALHSPFIRYDNASSRYEMHSILSELLARKRMERGAFFERECLLRAGNFCRDNNKNAESLAFYWQAKHYEGILSLDFSSLIFDKVGDTAFSEIAQDIAQNCPAEIKNEYALSMLRIAWALKAAGIDMLFCDLLDELDLTLERDGMLRAEWQLLSSYRFFPDIDKMVPLLKEAAFLFGGNCSRVILPDAPWCFGDYSQMATFHWLPGEADWEADRLEEFISFYSKLTGGHGSGADALFRAELAHYRGNLNEAEILAYKAIFLAQTNEQSIIQFGAAMHLCEIAVEKADLGKWQNALNSMEHAAANLNSATVRTVLDTLRGLLLNELGHHDRIPGWLKDMEQIKTLPPALRSNALFVHISFLMHKGEFTRMIGILQATRESEDSCLLLCSQLSYILIAIGQIQTKERALAAVNLERALEQGMPDGLVYLFAAHHELLKGLSEELISVKYSEHLSNYLEIKKRFMAGFGELHSALLPGSAYENLTEREREIALLAARGLKNSEIAKQLTVTENTVRTHLHTIFQKLDIDRRAKLAGKLLKD